MNEYEFAKRIADDLWCTGDFSRVYIEGPHVYVILGDEFGKDAGTQFTLLVIREGVLE